MASAAVVGADVTAPSLPNSLDTDEGITGAIRPNDEGTPELEDDALPDDALPDDVELEADDLFGDDEEGSDIVSKQTGTRKLDDDELDSGDDEGREDRARDRESADVEAGVEQTQSFNYTDGTFTRHAVPESSDGELYFLKIPRFMTIEPNEFHHGTFQPPTTDHHNKGPPSSTFSVYNTALSTIRWRHSPSNPSELQSNSRILRWSDGSLTLQMASQPNVQFEINANALAPPQRNPVKPTPTSIRDNKSSSRSAFPAYDASKDSFTYLATPCNTACMLRIAAKLTTSLNVVAAADGGDDAIERLQMSIAAQKGPHTGADFELVQLTEDPELQKKKAEVAEREKLRAARRLEAQQNRETDRSSRVLGRAGIRSGLTVGGLEDEEGGGRRRPKITRPRARRDEYSDDEEYYGHSRTREDEYEEDDFVAGDEEEDEGVDDGEDVDAIIERRDRQERQQARNGLAERQREGTPKRPAAAVDVDEDGDVVASKAPRAKKRRVVEDDDEDEE